MKGIAWLIVIVLVAGGAWYLFGTLEDTSQESASQVQDGESTDPIVVGAILPLTGEGAAYGLPIQKAGQLAVDEINAAGGIAGRELSVIWEDGLCDSKGASAAAQKLINVDGVSFILGGVCSSEVLAGAPLAESAGVVWISPSATSPDITNAGDYIFRTSPSDALAGEIAAQFAYNTLEAKTAAVISETKDYTQGLRAVFTASFEELGGVILVNETFNSDDTDFRTQVLKVKSSDPDVVYVLPQAPDKGLLLVKQLNEQGVDSQILTAEVLMGREDVKNNSKDLEGIIGIEPFFNEELPLSQGFKNAFVEKNDEELAFPSFMANYYSGFYLLKEAVEAVGTNTAAVKAWLYTINEWEHALGSLSFDENGDPRAQYQVLRVTDGDVEQLELVIPQ